MSVKTFIDTNVLVYAHDIDQGEKRSICEKLLVELLDTRMGVLSPQVLQEFYINVTRKIKSPLPRRFAREIVADLSVLCIDVSARDVTTAFRIEDESKIGFWDALICASALRARAEVVLSEDMNAGQQIAGLRVENPFRKGNSKRLN